MAATVRAGKPGFAAMDPEKLKGIARRRGLAVQRLGKAHMFTREEAREGGQKRRPHSQSRPGPHGKDWPPRRGESAQATREGEKP